MIPMTSPSHRILMANGVEHKLSLYQCRICSLFLMPACYSVIRSYVRPWKLVRLMFVFGFVYHELMSMTQSGLTADLS